LKKREKAMLAKASNVLKAVSLMKPPGAVDIAAAKTTGYASTTEAVAEAEERARMEAMLINPLPKKHVWSF